jgi:hypothetical protein
MPSWRDRILQEFTPQVARLTLVADPDGLLFEEGILAGIRERGFELLPFAFRDRTATARGPHGESGAGTKDLPQPAAANTRISSLIALPRATFLFRTSLVLVNAGPNGKRCRGRAVSGPCGRPSGGFATTPTRTAEPRTDTRTIGRRLC